MAGVTLMIASSEGPGIAWHGLSPRRPYNTIIGGADLRKRDLELDKRLKTLLARQYEMGSDLSPNGRPRPPFVFQKMNIDLLPAHIFWGFSKKMDPGLLGTKKMTKQFQTQPN